MLNRLKYHAMRYTTVFWYGGGTLFIFMAIMLAAYPNDEETVARFLGILSTIGLDSIIGVDVDAPGFVLWIVLFAGTYLYMIIAVSAIRMGSRILPTRDDDAMELLLGSPPKSGKSLLIENWIGAQIALMVLMIPTWLIITVSSIIFDSADIIGRAWVMFLFFYAVGTFFLTLSMFGSIFFFSRSWGLRIGFFYFIYALIILFSATGVNKIIADNQPSDLDFEIDVGVLNVNLALDPGAILVSNDWNWLEFGIVIGMSMMFVLASYMFIERHDYIGKTGGRRNILGFIPTIDRNGAFRRRFPLIAEQLQRDKSFIIVHLIVFFILYPYEMILFEFAYGDNPQAFGDLINGFGGFFGVLLGGYTIPGSYVGFSITQFFALAWLYYSIYVFLVGANIPNRDVVTSSQDLTYGNRVTLQQVVIHRSIAMVIGLTMVISMAAVSNAVFGAIFGFERNLGRESAVFLVAWIAMIGFGLLITAITMIPPISKGKRVGFWFYLFTILSFIFANLDESYEFVGYLSVIDYLDFAGIVLGKVEIIDQILVSLAILVIGLVSFGLSLQQYKRKDLI